MVAFFTDTMICGFSLYQILAYFLVYSCIGWCLEVVYAAVSTGQLVNRGFLNGPVCGRLVCDRCFLICEDLDLCIACAKALRVRGDVVAGEVSDPRRAPAESAGRISKNRR